jgi:protocatechuate 3,4-dioxygenase beta subunit
MTAIADHPELGVDPPYHSPDYRSTSIRAPSQGLVLVGAGFFDRSGPVFGTDGIRPGDADLTGQHAGDPLGERINVSGRLLDSEGRPIAGQLVELWQANAAGRYHHPVDQHPAPLDPNFSGAGRCLTGPDGAWRFVTVKPGAYPWGNHPNAWRPAHLHFSVFGRVFSERLVTQMYFPGDPLLEWDPIFNSVRDETARRRLIAHFDWATTQEEWALGYRFDIVLDGHLATPAEGDR